MICCFVIYSGGQWLFSRARPCPPFFQGNHNERRTTKQKVDSYIDDDEVDGALHNNVFGGLWSTQRTCGYESGTHLSPPFCHLQRFFLCIITFNVDLFVSSRLCWPDLLFRTNISWPLLSHCHPQTNVKFICWALVGSTTTGWRWLREQRQLTEVWLIWLLCFWLLL